MSTALKCGDTEHAKNAVLGCNSVSFESTFVRNLLPSCQVAGYHVQDVFLQ